MSESEVVTAIDNGVLTITLNRPEARNAATLTAKLEHDGCIS